MDNQNQDVKQRHRDAAMRVLNHAFRNEPIEGVSGECFTDMAAELARFDATRTAELESEIASWRRTATNRQYMIEALVQMLGPTGLKVWQGWQEKGVQRVHHSWGPEARSLTGEQRAQAILDWDAAPKQRIDNLDGHLARTALNPKEN